MSSETVVYIVDDDESVRLSTAFVLETVGHRVETYADGAAFLSAVSPEQRAVAIFDLRMPGIDGAELLLAVRARGWSIPVILVSGHTDETVSAEVLAAGAFDVLEKPYEDNQLLLVIDRALEGTG